MVLEKDSPKKQVCKGSFAKTSTAKASGGVQAPLRRWNECGSVSRKRAATSRCCDAETGSAAKKGIYNEAERRPTAGLGQFFRDEPRSQIKQPAQDKLNRGAGVLHRISSLPLALLAQEEQKRAS